LWGGLYELPTGEPLVGETTRAAAQRIARERAGLDVGLPAPFAAPDDRFVQELTHLRITFHAFRAEAAPGARVRRRGYDAHAWFDFTRPRLVGVSRSTGRLLGALAGKPVPAAMRAGALAGIAARARRARRSST